MTEEEARLDSAAIYLFEGQKYLKFRFHPKTPQQLKAFARLHRSPAGIVYRIELLAASVFMLLALLERPAVIEAPPYAVAAIEAACLAFFIWDLVTRAQVGCEERMGRGRAWVGWNGWTLVARENLGAGAELQRGLHRV